MVERIGNVTAATFNGLRCKVVLTSVVDHADGDRSYLFPNDAPLGSTRYYQIEYLDSDELYEAGETEDAVPGHAIAFGESQAKPKRINCQKF
jgi:hypothetical protein